MKRRFPAFHIRLAGFVCVLGLFSAASLSGQGTRLLRQPTLSATQVAFEYGGDLWVVSRQGGEAVRLTSTPAIEMDPHFSPDGRWIAFTSDRTGSPQVWVVASTGGEPRRLTWHPSASYARGWSPDGKEVLYASDRDAAPVPYAHLWLAPLNGGPPHEVPEAMAVRGSFSPDGKEMVVDRVDRWDVEFRNYRGGQNTPLTILNLGDLSEMKLPNDRTTDTWPVWHGSKIWFLSDRDYATNVWSYDVGTKSLQQVTHFKDADVKTLGGSASTNALVFEEDGWLWLLDPATGQAKKMDITVRGDFPWAMPHWTEVSRNVMSAALSPTGKRAVFEAMGDIFTVPADKGSVRNLTHSSGAADRSPLWSPDGAQVAWFSDSGDGYKLFIGDQDGSRETPRDRAGQGHEVRLVAGVVARRQAHGVGGSAGAHPRDGSRVGQGGDGGHGRRHPEPGRHRPDVVAGLEVAGVREGVPEPLPSHRRVVAGQRHGDAADQRAGGRGVAGVGQRRALALLPGQHEPGPGQRLGGPERSAGAAHLRRLRGRAAQGRPDAVHARKR